MTILFAVALVASVTLNVALIWVIAPESEDEDMDDHALIK